MYICICGEVTDEEIRQAISRGENSLEKLSRALGVALNCCTCIDEIEDMLYEQR